MLKSLALGLLGAACFAAPQAHAGSGHASTADAKELYSANLSECRDAQTDVQAQRCRQHALETYQYQMQYAAEGDADEQARGKATPGADMIRSLYEVDIQGCHLNSSTGAEEKQCEAHAFAQYLHLEELQQEVNAPTKTPPTGSYEWQIQNCQTLKLKTAEQACREHVTQWHQEQGGALGEHAEDMQRATAIPKRHPAFPFATRARGTPFVPGAIVCPSTEALGAMYHMFVNYVHRTAERPNGDDFAAFGCDPLFIGTKMEITKMVNGNPVVTAIRSDGVPISGVTMPGMVTILPKTN